MATDAEKDEMIRRLFQLYKQMFWLAWSHGVQDQDLQEINREVNGLHKDYFKPV